MKEIVKIIQDFQYNNKLKKYVREIFRPRLRYMINSTTILVKRNTKNYVTS